MSYYILYTRFARCYRKLDIPIILFATTSICLTLSPSTGGVVEIEHRRRHRLQYLCKTLVHRKRLKIGENKIEIDRSGRAKGEVNWKTVQQVVYFNQYKYGYLEVVVISVYTSLKFKKWLCMAIRRRRVCSLLQIRCIRNYRKYGTINWSQPLTNCSLKIGSRARANRWYHWNSMTTIFHQNFGRISSFNSRTSERIRYLQ